MQYFPTGGWLASGTYLDKIDQAEIGSSYKSQYGREMSIH